MIRSPLRRAISICSAARSASSPRCSRRAPRRPDLVLRLQGNTLLGIRAMIDADFVPKLKQLLVGQRRPALTPFAQQRPVVPGNHLLAERAFRMPALPRYHFPAWSA